MGNVLRLFYLPPRQGFSGPSRNLPVKKTVHSCTDGSYRTFAGAGWIIARDSHEITSHGNDSGTIVHQGSANMSPNQTAFDAEVAALERATRWLAGHHVAGLQHITVHSTSAIARCQRIQARAGQNQASQIAYHIDCLLEDGVTANI
jgi:hypothetical protein